MPTWKHQHKSAWHRERRLATVLWLTTMRTQCLHCGEDNPVVLDFHHRVASQKKFTLIGSQCYSRSRQSILSEIAKCDVLCANCHRKEEFRIRNDRTEL